MDDYDSPPAPDDCQRGLTLVRMAQAVDMTDDPDAALLLLRGMQALVHKMDPPRGELIAFPGKDRTQT